MKARNYLSLVVSALAVLPLTAAADAGTFYLTPEVGIESFESSVGLDQSTAFGLSGTYMYTDHLGADIEYLRSTADVHHDSREFDIDQAFVHGIYSFGKMGYQNRYEPFLKAGVGHVLFDGKKLPNFEQTELGAGLGVRLHFNDKVSAVLSAEQRYGTTAYYQSSMYTLGLSYAFGGTPAAAPVVAAPAPVAVAAPLDSDRDGVYDDKDQCPNTPAGREVDEKGCEYHLKKTEEMKLDILFATNKSDITDQYAAEVERAAKFLKRYAAVQATVEGHTDSDGSDVYNQKLSQRRADAVKAMLVTRYGIDAARLTSVGYGESRPVTSNATKEGKAQNRRVVAVFKAEVEQK